jgi:hypothetical protein
MTFEDINGREREFRKDRCFITGKIIMAQHANSSAASIDSHGVRLAQRITKAVIELQVRCL